MDPVSIPLGPDDARLQLRFQKDRLLRLLLVSDPRAQVDAATQVASDLRAIVDAGAGTGVEYEAEHGHQLELLLSEYLPMCVRLGTTAPFEVIRDAFSELLTHISAVIPNTLPTIDAMRRAALRASHFVAASNLSEATRGSDTAVDATYSLNTIDCVAENADEEVAALFRAIFLRTGRVTHLVQVLSWHKRYLALFDQCVSVIMQRVDGGALPLPWRNYVALMASSELRCEYTARLQQDMFIVNGGDRDWLEGLLWVPTKLCRLKELSSLLAHQPWLVTEHHVAELLRGVRRQRNSSADTPSECSVSGEFGSGEDAEDPEDEHDEAGDSSGACWSLAELMNAIMVMCHFHATSIIALGVGCAEEIDLDSHGPFVSAASRHYESIMCSFEHDKADVEERGELEDRLDAEEECRGETSGGEDVTEQEDELFFARAADSEGDVPSTVTSESLLERKLVSTPTGSREDEGVSGTIPKSIESCESGVEYGVRASKERDGAWKAHEGKTTVSDSHKTLWRFCGGSVLRYEDFDVRSDAYKVLHTEDFSWDEHCFSLVRRYFPGEAGQILEDLFNLTSKLTYDFFGSRQEAEVDTSPYRDAVWFYVHRIFGICHDDYDYRQVNEYLNRPTKLFLKKVACTPWKVRRRDFEHFDRALSASEKCHVVLIVAEARKQAGLMFALRAVMNYMR